MSQAPRCASHRGVKLQGVHHTAVSSSAICITPRSQTAHHRVRIKFFESLWLLLKGQSGEILLGLNISIMKAKIWRNKFWFAKPKMFTPQLSLALTHSMGTHQKDVAESRCHAHRRVEFFEIFDRISWRNRNQIRKYRVYQGPRWIQVIKQIKVENLVTHSL